VQAGVFWLSRYPRQVSPGEDSWPEISRDGTKLIYTTTHLFSVSVDGTDEKLEAELKPLPLLGQHYDVSAKGEAAYIQLKPGKPELWMMELK
jgi:hypothetical protein